MSEPTEVEVDDDRTLVREYSADGTICVYHDEESNEHVIVAQEREHTSGWVERRPAERTAVVEGQRLWSIPENWEKVTSLTRTNDSERAIYRIPERGELHVEVSVPKDCYLVDAWYGVESVGEYVVEWADTIQWERLERYLPGDDGEILDGQPEIEAEAVQTVYNQREDVESRLRELVDKHAQEAYEHTYGASSESAVDPWGHEQPLEEVLEEYLSDEEVDAFLTLLRNTNAPIPIRPVVAPRVKRRILTPAYYLTAAIEAGATPAPALDWYMCDCVGLSQTEWAETRRKGQSTISNNVRDARNMLEVGDTTRPALNLPVVEEEYEYHQ